MGVFRDPTSPLREQIRASDESEDVGRCAVVVRGVMSPPCKDTPRSPVSPFAASQADSNIRYIPMTLSSKSGAASCTLSSMPSPAGPPRKSAALIASLKRFGSKLLGSKSRRLVDMEPQQGRFLQVSCGWNNPPCVCVQCGVTLNCNVLIFHFHQMLFVVQIRCSSLRDCPSR